MDLDGMHCFAWSKSSSLCAKPHIHKCTLKRDSAIACTVQTLDVPPMWNVLPEPTFHCKCILVYRAETGVAPGSFCSMSRGACHIIGPSHTPSESLWATTAMHRGHCLVQLPAIDLAADCGSMACVFTPRQVHPHTLSVDLAPKRTKSGSCQRHNLGGERDASAPGNKFFWGVNKFVKTLIVTNNAIIRSLESPCPQFWSRVSILINTPSRVVPGGQLDNPQVWYLRPCLTRPHSIHRAVPPLPSCFPLVQLFFPSLVGLKMDAGEGRKREWWAGTPPAQWMGSTNIRA